MKGANWFIHFRNEWVPLILQFLYVHEVLVLEKTCVHFRYICQHWLGDEHSRRIRPLGDVDTKTAFPPNLLGVYQEPLILWSLAIRKFHDGDETHKDYDSMMYGVVDSMFTTGSFTNSKLTKLPLQEQAWQNTCRMMYNHMADIFTAIEDLGWQQYCVQNQIDTNICQMGLTRFNNLSDRRKLFFLERTVERAPKPDPTIASFAELSLRALSLILPNNARYTKRFSRYILWTVWGPQYPLNERNIVFHPTQMPPSQPVSRWQYRIALDPGMLDALPRGPFGYAYLQRMFSLKPMLWTRWYLDTTFQIPVDIIEQDDRLLIEFEIARRAHVENGFCLAQRILIFADRIEIEYDVVTLATDERLRLFTEKYDPTIPQFTESPEVMCWKYLPIWTVSCRFQMYSNGTPHKRKLSNLHNPTIMKRQSENLRAWLEREFWKTMSLPSSLGSVRVTPCIPIVNNTVWNVFCSYTAP